MAVKYCTATGGANGKSLPNRHMSGIGEREQARQRSRTAGQGDVEVEPRRSRQGHRPGCGRRRGLASVSNPGSAASSPRKSAEPSGFERRVGDEPACVAEDELDVWVAEADAVADQQECRAGGVEEEVRRERRDAVDGRAGQFGGVNEHQQTSTSAVEFGEQLLVFGLTEVGAVGVGQQDHPVGAEIIERPCCFGQRLIEVRGVVRVAKNPNRSGLSLTSSAEKSLTWRATLTASAASAAAPGAGGGDLQQIAVAVLI